MSIQLQTTFLTHFKQHLTKKVGDVQGQKQIHHYLILIDLSMRYGRTFSNSSRKYSPKKVGYVQSQTTLITQT
jgi:hypothetical protein